MIEIKSNRGGAVVHLEPKTFYKNEWADIEPMTMKYGEWSDGTSLNKEIGAYTSWFSDPSTSVMLHYQTIDDTPVECLFRKEGSLEWQTVKMFTDKPFPNTSRRVRWFKLEGLDSSTLYETKLKYHQRIHRFKTMPSVFNRSLKFVMISDQINSEANFQTEGTQGFNIMHDNNIDAIVIAGDMVHDDGVRTNAWILWWEKYFEIERQRNLMIPMVVCFGNHDGRVNNTDGTFKSLLWLVGGGTKDHVVFAYNFFSNLNDVGYGTVDISNYLSLVFLNTGHTEPIKGRQTSWLNVTLSERVGRHIFPFMHAGPYPAYYAYSSGKDVRDNWTPLFAQYGVKIVGSGHEHVNLITKKVLVDSIAENGVVFTGQGHGMGNITRETRIPENTWYVDFINNTQRALDIIEFKVDGSVDLNKVTLDGAIMYQKTL